MSSALPDAEYAVLRHTIASRGTARMVLFPVVMIAWASLALLVLTFADAPIASLYSLAVLAGGFEAIHALHVGVERIGRYLQVYYENAEAGPRWESTVMAVGPALPGGGIDPLFTVVFTCAAFVNVIPALALQPRATATELGGDWRPPPRTGDQNRSCARARRRASARSNLRRSERSALKLRTRSRPFQVPKDRDF
jgi:hypothetical protein